MKKVWAMLLITVMLAAAGCGTKTAGQKGEQAEGNSQAETPETGDKKFKVGFVNIGKENRFQGWIMQEYDKKVAEDYPDLDFITFDSENSAEKQIDMVEMAMSSQVDLILFYPYDSNLALGVLNNAVSSGTPVLTVGARMDDDGVLPYVDGDMYASAAILAEYACTILPENAKLGVLKGTPGNQHSEFRYQAWIDTLEEKRPDVTIIDTQYGNWMKDEAMRYTEDWLQIYPDLAGVIAVNDDMAMGASEAGKLAGKTEFYTFGFDGLGDACLAIEAGDLTATMLQDANALVGESLKIIEKAASGEDISDAHVLVDGVLINEENASEWVEKHRTSGIIE